MNTVQLQGKACARPRSETNVAVGYGGEKFLKGVEANPLLLSGVILRQGFALLPCWCRDFERRRSGDEDVIENYDPTTPPQLWSMDMRDKSSH